MNVYRVLQAFQFLPRLTGAAPYGISTVGITFSKFGRTWSLLTSSIAAMLICIYCRKIPQRSGDMKTLLITMTTCLQLFIAFFSVLKDGFLQETMINIVQSLNYYDVTTGYGDDAFSRQENKRFRFWNFIYSVLLIILAAGRFWAWKILDLDLANEIFVMQIDNSIHMFSVFTTLLGLRVRHLNCMLEQHQYIKVHSSGFDSVASAEYVRVLYTDLVAIGVRLNAYYSSRLFLWTALITLVLVTRYHNMLTVGVSAMFVTATIIKLVPVVLGLVYFSIACQFTAEQVNKTPIIVLEKNMRHTTMMNRGRKEILTMSLYMAMRNFEFSASGFFTVDFSLIYAIVGITVTYLTLCLQSSPS